MSRFDILKQRPNRLTPEARELMQEQTSRMDVIAKFLQDQPQQTILEIGRLLAKDNLFLENADPELYAKIRNRFGDRK
jgi:hypothetical protein